MNTSEYFIGKKNQKKCEKFLNECTKIGLNFKNGKGYKEVVNFKSPEKIADDLLEPIPEKGMNLSTLLKEFDEKVIDGSVNFSSNHFLAFPDCGNSLAAMGGNILSGMLNQNLINSMHCSPTATFVEIATINWLREIVGYPVCAHPKEIADVGGINVPGGVMANTVGLLLAREKKFPGTIHTGIKHNPSKIKVFIPKGIGHYSIKAALGWLGLGDNNLVEVETTEKFVIDQKDLIKKIEEYKQDKENVLLALVAYTGDSRTMAIDDFPSLSKIAKENNMWFHIDACHGLSLCFSEKMREKVKGIDLADSVTIDPHKVLFIPYNLSYVLVKNPSDFNLISGVSDLITQEPYSFGQITPFLGSRAFNSVKLWFLIKHLGKKRIGKLIEKRHELVKFFASIVNKTPDFYMMNDVTINSAAFIYVPEELKTKLEEFDNLEDTVNKINNLNMLIQKKIFKDGDFYIHTFKLNDFKNVMHTGNKTVFQMQRLMLGNPLTTKKDLFDLISYLKKTAKSEWELIKNEQTK